MHLLRFVLIFFSIFIFALKLLPLQYFCHENSANGNRTFN
jgi:hypothetical protein